MSNTYMKAQNEFPKIPTALLKALEEAFPPQDFGVSESVCKLNFHYGQRSVVNFLKNKHQIQNESILSTSSIK